MQVGQISMEPGGMPVPLTSLVEVQVRFAGQQVHAGFPSPAAPTELRAPRKRAAGRLPHHGQRPNTR